MTKTVCINVRVEPELRKNIVVSAHELGNTTSGVMLWSSCMYFAEHSVRCAGKFEEMIVDMKPGEQRNKIDNLRQIALDKSVYWFRQAKLITAAKKEYENIESAESYLRVIRAEMSNAVEA